MTLAYTLSRLPNPKDKGVVELDLRVVGVEMTTAEVHRCGLNLVNFHRGNSINFETRQPEIRP